MAVALLGDSGSGFGGERRWLHWGIAAVAWVVGALRHSTRRGGDGVLCAALASGVSGDGSVGG